MDYKQDVFYILATQARLTKQKQITPYNSDGYLSQEMHLVSKKSGEYKPVTVYTDPLTGKRIAPDVGWNHNPADFR